MKKRWEIVILHKHRLGLKIPKKKLSKVVRVSIDSINHWVDVYERTGDVEAIPSSGRNKITGLKEDQVIQNLVFENPAATATQISQECKSIEITVSASTVRRRLRGCGMQYTHPISKPLLKKTHRIARVQFAEQNIERLE